MKKKSAPTFDRYVHAPDCARHIEGLELPPELWAVFALAAKPVSAEEIGRRLDITPKDAQAALSRLARRKLVRKHVLGWASYVAGMPSAALVVEPVAPAPVPAQALVAPPVSPVSSAIPFPPVVSAEAFSPVVPPIAVPMVVAPVSSPVVARAPAPEPSPSDAMSGAVRFVLRNSAADARRAALQAGLVRFTIEKKPSAATPVSAPVIGRKLRPILDSIIQKGGGGLNGQLLVYRVFMRVPADLIAACGLRSLKLVNPDLEIKDERLYQAIEAASRDVAGIALLPRAA